MDVRRHSPDLIKHIVFDPIVILEVQAEGLLGEILSQCFLSENSPRHSFQIFHLLPVIVLFKANVIQSLDLTLLELIFPGVWIRAKEGRLRVERSFCFSLWVHLLEIFRLLTEASCG